jgi:hypothetical protein
VEDKELPKDRFQVYFDVGRYNRRAVGFLRFAVEGWGCGTGCLARFVLQKKRSLNTLLGGGLVAAPNGTLKSLIG